MPFILKIRYFFLNFLDLFKILLYIYMHIYKFLRIILFLDVENKDGYFYFFRLNIFIIIMTVLIFPINLLTNFINYIYLFIHYIQLKEITMLNYLNIRLHFTIISILFILLFNIKRIDFIILI
jgi:hypothetical protein